MNASCMENDGTFNPSLATEVLSIRAAEKPIVSAAISMYTSGDAHLSVVYHAISLILGSAIPSSMTYDVLTKLVTEPVLN